MPALTFIFALLLSFGLLMAGSRPKSASKTLRLRLERMRIPAEILKAGSPLLALRGVQGPPLSARLGARLARYKFSKKLSRLLLHSGSDATVGGFLLLSCGTSLGASLVALLCFPLAPVMLACLLLGALAPWGVVRIRRTRRIRKFTTAMPDAVDLMARSLRAGHSIGATIEMVAEQSSEPLAGEFGRVFQQQRFGLRFRDALLEMADRVPSADLHFLVTAVLIQRETGGDLTEILDRTTHVIRERVRIEGEVRVYTAQGRLTGWILSLLPIFLLAAINIMSPGYSRLLFEDPTGQKLLCGGGCCILFGGFLISRIVDVKV